MNKRQLGESRSAILFGLLLLSLVLTGLLALQALDAARSHRATAEGVLRDYAALAAREFVRRTEWQLDYYEIRPALAVLQESPSEVPKAPPADAQTDRPGPALVKSYYRMKLPDGPPQLGDPALQGLFGGEVRRQMLQRLADWPAKLPYTLLFCSDQESVLVYKPSSAPQWPNQVEGFVAPLQVFVSQMQTALKRGPLMPPTLGGESLDNALLSITVRRPSGGQIFQGERVYGYTRISAYEDFGEVFGGLQAVVTLHPDAAARLIIGGLPTSRVPLLLALMLLNMGLLAAALLQLRRERQLARRQSDFIAAVSHELRTPLAQIQMFSDTLLLGRVRSKQEKERSLEIISQETQRLAHLVENIIQFSRSVRRKVSLRPCPTDPRPVLREVRERFAPLASSSQAQVRLKFEEGEGRPPMISADPEALRRMVLNLLDNAVKYGPAGQTVTVGLSVGQGRVQIRVEDEGEGIPAADRQRIFKRFERLDRHRNAAVAGTGIGLSVVRELAESQGGKVWAESGPRGGARFVVEFPALQAEEEPDASSAPQAKTRASEVLG